MRHEKILSELEKLAVDVLPVASARLAAAIVYKKEIVGYGINQKKTHPLQSRYSTNSKAIYLHAEIAAIANSLKRIDVKQLANSTLYISRMKYSCQEKTSFIRGLARPCEGCTRAIAAFDLKHVCFTTDEGYDWV